MNRILREIQPFVLSILSILSNFFFHALRQGCLTMTWQSSCVRTEVTKNNTPWFYRKK